MRVVSGEMFLHKVWFSLGPTLDGVCCSSRSSCSSLDCKSSQCPQRLSAVWMLAGRPSWCEPTSHRSHWKAWESRASRQLVWQWHLSGTSFSRLIWLEMTPISPCSENVTPAQSVLVALGTTLKPSSPQVPGPDLTPRAALTSAFTRWEDPPVHPSLAQAPLVLVLLRAQAYLWGNLRRIEAHFG